MIEIGTIDGAVVHQLVVRDRRISSRAGRVAPPDCALRFATATQGVRTFVSRRTISHLLRGLEAGTIRVDGNPLLLLWFYDLAQRILPLGERARWTTPPAPYVEPSTAAPWAARVIREPVAEALDPAWEAAARQRAKLKMLRVAAGEPTLEL